MRCFSFLFLFTGHLCSNHYLMEVVLGVRSPSVSLFYIERVTREFFFSRGEIFPENITSRSN